MTWRPDDVDTVDAVIIGSGPGGSTAADVLTSAGWSCVMLERGRNHLIATEPPYERLSEFSNDELKFMHRWFLGPDPLVEPRTFRRHGSAEEREWTGAVNDLPATVGGGGVHADGKLPRFRPADFKPVSLGDGPMPDSALADWPIGYADVEPYYEAAERVVGVAGDNSDNPFAAPRRGPYPMPPGAPMYGARIMAEHARALGYHPYPAATGANSVEYDGRPACVNCGHCGWFGCPIHAKGDPVAILQNALGTSLLALWPECFASRITHDGVRASGVDYVDPLGVERHVSARHIVLAGGAMESARLALLSGVGELAGGEHVGRHLMFHFQTLVTGFFDRLLFPLRGRSVSHAQDDSVVTDERALAAAREAGLPFIRGGLVEYAAGGHPIMAAKNLPAGPHHGQAMRSGMILNKLWTMIQQGEDMPMPHNRVDLDPSVTDVRGVPVARTTYAPHRHELVASAHWAPRLGEILTRAGAMYVHTSTSPDPAAPYGGFLSPVSESKHVVGTLRMGADPADGVVDPWQRMHALPNVVVCDGAPFVSSAGYGPTLTIVALSMRAAHGLAGTSLPLPLTVAAGPRPAAVTT
jgi:gluconate 2-dehydrogenase alpha chain